MILPINDSLSIKLSSSDEEPNNYCGRINLGSEIIGSLAELVFNEINPKNKAVISSLLSIRFDNDYQGKGYGGLIINELVNYSKNAGSEQFIIWGIISDENVNIFSRISSKLMSNQLITEYFIDYKKIFPRIIMKLTN